MVNKPPPPAIASIKPASAATTVSIKIISIESDMSMTPTLKIYDIKKASLKKSGSEYVG
jgi:hypothetical protein